MRTVPVDPDAPSRKALREAVGVLARGGLVAFPTETVYGLCADAGDPRAVERLRSVKDRAPDRAFAYLLPDPEAALDLVDRLPPLAERIAGHLWPGPVTLVVPGKGGERVGLRVPSLRLPRALAKAAKRPLLQTSCNRSGQPAALNGAAVVESLGDRVDLLLDGGRVPGGRSSTVVACDARRFRVLRRGAVKTAEIIRAAAELTLLVCTGNLCRSPLAEALLRDEVARRLDCDPPAVVRHGFRFASFGITAPEGEPPTDHAIRVAGELGLDIRRHRSRPFRIMRVDEAARVYGMTRAHLDFLSPYFVRRPDDLDLLAPKGREIPDPYGRSLKVYRRTAELIREACEKRAEELVPDDPGDEGE